MRTVRVEYKCDVCGTSIGMNKESELPKNWIKINDIDFIINMDSKPVKTNLQGLDCCSNECFFNIIKRNLLSNEIINDVENIEKETLRKPSPGIKLSESDDIMRRI